MKHYFSEETQNHWEAIKKRPKGEIHLLIGSEATKLHPVIKEKYENLAVVESPIGEGWAIYGYHEEVVGGSTKLNEDVSLIRMGNVTVSSGGETKKTPSLSYHQSYKVHPRVRIPVEVEDKSYQLTEKILQRNEDQGESELKIGELVENKEKINDLPVNATVPKDFHQIEELGVEPPRRCNSCRKCRSCSWRGMMQSEREAEEYRMIEEGISYCQEAGKFKVSYPYL